MLRGLLGLTEYHREHCSEYGAILDARGWGAEQTDRLEEIPFLPVRLFKQLELRSCPLDQVVRTLTSSGTTGQVPSRVFLDKETSLSQSNALIKIFQSFLGTARLPMLIIDTPSIVKTTSTLTARGAGVRGMSILGRDPTFALREDLTLDFAVVDSFLDRYGETDFLIYGSTVLIWKYFVQALREQNRSLPKSNGVLIHTGGWKALQQEAVDNAQFKERVYETCGIRRVHNFYGMAEQVGSVFVECEEGVLHAPAFADLLVRRGIDWETLPRGERGIVQVVSLLPRSYPGHSLLTEDLGTIVGEDDCPCGRLGKTFLLHGRVPAAELRGCGVM